MGLFSWDADLSRPVAANVKAVAISGWGRPREGHTHQGIDIPLPIGTPIKAMRDGVVVRSQAKVDGDAGGIRVAIKHPDGLVSWYMHLARADLTLGQRVARGQQVGLSGNTGIFNSGPHLHASLRAPAELLPKIEAAGGKPISGWGPNMAPYGYAIPGETWIPVDEYNARTIADAKANGIALRKASSGGGQILLGAAVAYGIWRLWRG
jgi:murein DD-endopeptidase MepM/ murein hydrolase activator NlpD